MPATEKLRAKLLKKLTELFQLDQPDLDFGFYRIMHAKAEQVQSFVDNDLLQIIEDSFGQVGESHKAKLQANYEKAVQTAIEFGAPNPEETDGVKKAKAAFDAIKDGASAEANVYDHLFRFFERYYDTGDFISRRYYSRETAGRAAPFAIPYNGEEIKLHWANADQYYIKTAEYFSNFTFDLSQSAEVRKMSKEEQVLNNITEKNCKAHFRIINAAEGEHGNVKLSDEKKRFFLLYENTPVEINENNELIINFEYKSIPGGKNSVDKDTEKELKNTYGRSLLKRDMPNLFISKKVLDLLDSIKISSTYKSLLTLPAPTDKISNRPLLAKYINQYTSRNTMDYFIHKDLGAFLKRELDFYIKNEVMHLDDIENADVPAVESYLAKLKVIRKIATKLIEFLAQLENFQKKLWLKKKFVVETNYCITLDRVPEEFYPEIITNKEQHDEWINLFAIDEIKATDGELFEKGTPEYSNPLTIEFLKINNKLVLDTKFFNEAFKEKLLESLKDFDEQCDGLLIHSENFQALNLLQKRYREQVKCVYIDPPYNTGEDGFIYKDGYPDSTWLSCMESRLINLSTFLKNGSSIWINIDDNEAHNLKILCDSIWGKNSFIAANIWQKRYSRENREAIGDVHDYIFTYSPTPLLFKENRKKISLTEKQAKVYTNPNSDPKGRWRTIPLTAQAGHATKDQFYEIQAPGGKVFLPPQGRCWGIAKATFEKYCNEGRIYFGKNNNSQPNLIRYLSEVDGMTPWTWWPHEEVGNTDESKKELYSILKKDTGFETPKPSRLLNRIIHIATDENSLTFDYFAGSGTTGHAVINLNREDDGKRKYILVEMGDYFDTVLKPRIQKVVYSKDWKNGKPINHNTGISHCFKYLCLESYEDTLNNLVFEQNTARDKVMAKNSSLREDYMLKYMLDVETKGSQSLLNIDAFVDPLTYVLKIKKPGSDEQITQKVDLIETFNYLIGLRVIHLTPKQQFTAKFTRKPDPELPKDQNTKLTLDDKIIQTAQGKWWFKKVEGWIPADTRNPNNGQLEKILIVWRNLTGNLEEDNLILDEWFREYCISTSDFKFDIVYVNGSNNLSGLKRNDANLKVRLIEEEFHKTMWNPGGEA